jgi:hypothetical protein
VTSSKSKQDGEGGSEQEYSEIVTDDGFLGREKE